MFVSTARALRDRTSESGHSCSKAVCQASLRITVLVFLSEEMSRLLGRGRSSVPELSDARRLAKQLSRPGH